MVPLRAYRLLLIDSCPLGEENSRLLLWIVTGAGLLGLSGVLASMLLMLSSDRKVTSPARAYGGRSTTSDEKSHRVNLNLKLPPAPNHELCRV